MRLCLISWPLAHSPQNYPSCRLLLVLLVSLVNIQTGAMQRPGQEPSFPAYPHQEDVAKLALSQNSFTWDMYVKLAQTNSGNLFFSPFSIMAALGMTLGGSAGNTEQEMCTVMHVSQDKDSVHNAFQDVVGDLKKGAAEYELRTSNMAYISDQLAVLSEYGNLLKEKYHSMCKTVDFNNGESVRQEINAVVEKETNSRIKDLIPQGVLDHLTRMVLVNAVYFKGLWDKQFDSSNTYDQQFWTSATESVTVPMMHKKSHFRLFMNKDLGASMLAMDYKGSRLSMVFVLPDKRDGLAEVEAKLVETNLSEVSKKMRSVEVEVTIPKFKLEESLELVDSLKSMGMNDLFDQFSCDLSGVAGTKDLYVSKVIHKAFLEVNEEGTEAAAATAVVAQTRMMMRPIPPFIADHPFVFYIWDHRSDFVYFAGRLIKPQ